MSILDARFAKPLDEKAIIELASNHEAIITIEEGSIEVSHPTLQNFYLIEVFLIKALNLDL